MRARRPLLLTVLMLAACGRTQGPVEIPPKDLPFPVAREATPTESLAPPRTFTVYFGAAGRLSPIVREIQTDLPPAEAAMRALLDGPTVEERARGFGTALPSAVRLLTVTIVAETAHVDLSGEFQEPAPPDRIALRVAQVVWTLTGLPGVGSVRFAIDGEPAAVTTGDGAAVDRPVVRADYVTLAPR